MQYPLRLLLFSICLLSANVLAADSLVRVGCDDDAIGAEVSIDGKFKGECPLDFSVPEGNHKLSAVKKVDEENIRLYELAFRIGEGVAKRLDIGLGPAQLNELGKLRKVERERAEAQRLAEAKRLEEERQRIEKLRLERLEEDSDWQRAVEEEDRQAYQGFMEKHPNSRYTNQAMAILEEDKNLPAKPRLPIKIKDRIWKKIVNSEAYRNAPNVASEANVTIRATEFTKFNSWLVKNTTKDLERQIQIHTISDKCYKFTDSYPIEYSSFTCANIPIDSNGTIDHIDIEGSLFPLHAGASQTSRSSSGSVKQSKSCKVIKDIPAKQLYEKLSGDAWEIFCNYSYSSGETVIHNEFTTFYLNDIGLYMNQIGILDPMKKIYIIPSPEYETVLDYGNEDYGGKIISTYHDYKLFINGQLKPVFNTSQ